MSNDGDDDWKAGGRFDGFVDLDSEGIGLWSGTGLRTHFEYRFGDRRGSAGGALFPVNTAAVLPLGGCNDLVVSSIYLTQSLGSRTTLMLGKINAVDLLAADPFFGGSATKRFMNMVFVAPPSGVANPRSVAMKRAIIGATSLAGFDGLAAFAAEDFGIGEKIAVKRHR